MSKSQQYLAAVNSELDRISAKSQRRHKELKRLNQQKLIQHQVLVDVCYELRVTQDELSKAMLRIAELERDLLQTQLQRPLAQAAE